MTERNLIQAPELIRSLQQSTGVKQGSIVPTLGEHVQPVIVLQDLARENQRVPWRYGLLFEVDATALGPLLVSLFNPLTSKVLVTVKMLHVSIFVNGDDAKWWIDNTDYSLGAGVIGTPGRGTRKIGTQVASQNPTPVPGDLLKVPTRSTAIATAASLVTAGQYLRTDNTDRVNTLDWCPEGGIVLPPGSGLVFCHYGSTAHDAIAWEWEEQPL